MVNTNVVTIPQSREDVKVTEEYQKILKERNELIAKRFKMDQEDVTLQFYDSKGALVGSLGPNQNGYGIYSGYVDGTNEIKILHPAAAEGLLDDIPKEMVILIDSALTKLYLCKKYYPEDKDFKLYYKYVAECLASFSAGNFHEQSIKFDLKIYFDGIKYKKDQELNILFYIMLNYSGLDSIFDKLDIIMEEKDAKKSCEKIYNKPLSELIKPEKEKVIAEERKKLELEKAKRAAQREAMIEETKMRNLEKAQAERRGEKPNQNNQQRKFVSKANYKATNQKSNQNTQNSQGNKPNQNKTKTQNSNNKVKDWSNNKTFNKPKINFNK